MFEALFILTTIDTGTRIARFLLQEALGKIYPQFEQTDWLPGAVLATAVVTAGWGVLVCDRLDRHDLADVRHRQPDAGGDRAGGGDDAADQHRPRPIRLVTLLPMLFVIATTMTAAVQMVGTAFPAMIDQGQTVKGVLCMAMTVFVMVRRYAAASGGEPLGGGVGWADAGAQNRRTS